jgi:pyrimidine deaminase RibD-like protein
MEHMDFMRLAIKMAAKCAPADPRTTPRVGAAIAIDGNVVGLASRGEDDHAEKIAIAEAKKAGVDISKSVVYTTLEPCTAGVCRRTLDSCADRLVAEHPKKVVVGIHDPNLDVCGKGFLRLQNAGIETELFPKELALQISALNEEFIRAQQSLGIKITYPANGAELPTEAGSKVTLRGTWINAPAEQDQVFAIVERGGIWWPQKKLEPVVGQAEQWTTVVNIGPAGLHKVFVGKVNQLGKTLFDYYRKVIAVHNQWTQAIRQQINQADFNLPGNPWIGIEMEGPPKGIDKEHAVQFTITNIVN